MSALWKAPYFSVIEPPMRIGDHRLTVAALWLLASACGATAGAWHSDTARKPATPPTIEQLCEANRGSCGAVETTIVATPAAKSELVLHYIHVGHGNCTLIECPGEEAASVLVDCGSGARQSSSPNAPRTSAKHNADYVAAVLRERPGPVSLVLSHPHPDHINRVEAVLTKDIRVDRIFLGGKREKYGALRKWLEGAQSRGAKVEAQEDRSGESRRLRALPVSCGAAEVFQLAVDVGGGGGGGVAATNARSLGILLKYRSFSAVLPGDATGSGELPSEQAMLASLKQLGIGGPALRQLSVAASQHHGSKTHNSNSCVWVRAVRPLVTVFSSTVALGHPTCQAVYRYNEHALALDPKLKSLPPIQCTLGGKVTSKTRDVSIDRAVFTTEAFGTITAHTDGQALEIRCDRYSSGRGSYCGIRVNLDASYTPAPSRSNACPTTGQSAAGP